MNESIQEPYELVNENDPDILRIRNTKENLDLPPENISQKKIEDSEKEQKHFYSTPSEFLSAFEKSEVFEEILKKRATDLLHERPDLVTDHQLLIEGTRMTEAYHDGIISFYKTGHTMNPDLTTYDHNTAKYIEAYLSYLQHRNHSLKNKKLFTEMTDINPGSDSERYRDRLHNQAAISLIGESLNINGETVSDDESSEADQILDEIVFLHIGRRLVHLIAVELGLDIIDIDRERNKMRNARLKFGFGTNIAEK